ncbi:unnamed protein product [Citrullus colocynthis]|uniref:Uncharacterized protein n=1 Tax=Citrullus colocynthis TaxID=252529 RepID=A0ABP0YSC1_9ROSI
MRSRANIITSSLSRTVVAKGCRTPDKWVGRRCWLEIPQIRGLRRPGVVLVGLGPPEVRDCVAAASGSPLPSPDKSCFREFPVPGEFVEKRRVLQLRGRRQAPKLRRVGAAPNGVVCNSW